MFTCADFPNGEIELKFGKQFSSIFLYKKKLYLLTVFQNGKQKVIFHKQAYLHL